MSKNYKIGSKFRVTSNSTNGFNVGEIVNLVARRVDGLFEMDNGEFQQALYEDQFELVCEPLSQKLKPAKQALADAINQDGGLVEGGDWHKNGGLPPVGEVCEMKHKHSTANWARPGFEPVVIVASGKDLFIVSGTDAYRETVGAWDEYEFRPLRTEREKAIDEMQRIIEESNKHGVREQLGVLYDAGMYKEVK